MSLSGNGYRSVIGGTALSCAHPVRTVPAVTRPVASSSGAVPAPRAAHDTTTAS